MPRPGLRGALGHQPEGESATAFRERWAARSLHSGWPATADEWRCAAVDAVSEGLTTSGVDRLDLDGASRSLGEQRAAIGADLAESRSDFGIALGLARIRRRRRLELLDALTVGWAEQSIDRLTALPVLDPTTDMATQSYLSLRLGELYREAALTGTDVAREYVLIVVETDHTAHRLVAEARLTTLHSALQYAFVGGESIVAITSRRVLALANREEPRLSDSLARLRSELKIALAEGRLPSARSWRQSLPDTAGELPLAMIEIGY
ncbi:MAG: hypothetical protein J0H43_11695 [Actinobacteria bacterium]|nr:hypothetical protein [Actinomycetota bacterium]